ncbi:TRAF3-interacting protein 1 isoform X2 [Canis lupus familiaris]|uniref:TRAF3-interacting protein 1 isoform X7 n=1 Tax=Canis lupus dingo TaxID=286419 RepID=UPI000DC6782B|nr:TRAF3-interacting protein 1 isoform X7 [Canis lupus dingo]XP_038314287.1 TRAF3-interacting protein 1 isoform X2 [Canis lupus familiaris]
MNAAVVRRTQEALGKVIRRPPLTEKLLSKPPFRYLHDIITEVIRMTGFMKGLYTDAEMKSDNVKDKDAKISFLQKAIDVVVMVSGEPLSAKPVRIVAGHEPERTNELLQRIGKCCLSKLPSDEAVKRVLAGERSDLKGRTSLTSKSQELDNKNAREEEPGVHKDKEDKRNSEINERSTSRDGKQKEVKEESKAREKDKEKEKTKESDHDRHKDPERDKHREGERERARSRAKQDRDRGNRDRDRDPDRDRERRNEGGKEKEKWKDRERERERDKARDRDRDRRKVKDGEHSREPDREKSREPDKPEKKSSSSGEMSKKLSDGSVKDSKVEAETEISARASRSVTTKASKRRSKNSMEGRRDSRTSENSLSLEHNSSYSKAKKEHAVKQLDPIVSGLNNEADQETMSSEIGTKEANTSAASVSDDNSAGLWRQSLEPEPAVKQKGDSPSDAEGEVGLPGPEKSEVSESSELPSELPANIRIPRPGSARPAPPRVKRQDSVEALTPDRTGSGKIVASVIVDTQNSDNEEDDQFVVEAAPPLPEMSELEMVPAVDVEDEEKHGGLVKKILETKKDYEKLQRSPRPGEKGSHRDELGVSHTLNAAASAREKLLVFESAWKKEKDIVSKEIEKLRVSIQTLCKSALPLGKIMDYIQEDVDAMQNELQLWHNENKQHAEALQKEQSITDCAVEPLKAELAELEQLIKDQQDKICAVKANVLKNEEKIQRMVYSINLSSRR